MDDLLKRGRPRQFAPCPKQYGGKNSHRFDPKTGRCPCGMQRPEIEPVERQPAESTKPVRVSKRLLDRLQAIGKKSGESVAKLVHRALEEYISFNG